MLYFLSINGFNFCYKHVNKRKQLSISKELKTELVKVNNKKLKVSNEQTSDSSGKLKLLLKLV